MNIKSTYELQNIILNITAKNMPVGLKNNNGKQ